MGKKHTDPLQHEYPPRSPLLRTRWRVLPYVTHGTQQEMRHVLKGEKHPNSELTHGWAGADSGVLGWRCSLGADMMIGGKLQRLWGGNSRSQSRRWAWSMTATRTETRRREGQGLLYDALGQGEEEHRFPPSSRPEGRLGGRDGPVQRERLDVEMKPSVDQHRRSPRPFLGAVPFVARLRGRQG